MKRYSTEERQIHLKTWRKSELSGQEYCRRNEIYPTTFYGWSKREKKPSRKKNKSAEFIKIPSEKLQTGISTLEILIEYQGIKIHLPENTSSMQLEIVLSTLGKKHAS